MSEPETCPRCRAGTLETSVCTVGGDNPSRMCSLCFYCAACDAIPAADLPECSGGALREYTYRDKDGTVYVGDARPTPADVHWAGWPNCRLGHGDGNPYSTRREGVTCRACLGLMEYRRRSRAFRSAPVALITTADLRAAGLGTEFLDSVTPEQMDVAIDAAYQELARVILPGACGVEPKGADPADAEALHAAPDPGRGMFRTTTGALGRPQCPYTASREPDDEGYDCCTEDAGHEANGIPHRSHGGNTHSGRWRLPAVEEKAPSQPHGNERRPPEFSQAPDAPPTEADLIAAGWELHGGRDWWHPEMVDGLWSKQQAIAIERMCRKWEAAAREEGQRDAVASALAAEVRAEYERIRDTLRGVVDPALAPLVGAPVTQPTTYTGEPEPKPCEAHGERACMRCYTGETR